MDLLMERTPCTPGVCAAISCIWPGTVGSTTTNMLNVVRPIRARGFSCVAFLVHPPSLHFSLSVAQTSVYCILSVVLYIPTSVPKMNVRASFPCCLRPPASLPPLSRPVRLSTPAPPACPGHQLTWTPFVFTHPSL